MILKVNYTLMSSLHQNFLDIKKGGRTNNKYWKR